MKNENFIYRAFGLLFIPAFLMTILTSCAFHRHEPFSVKYDILIKIGYLSGGPAPCVESFALYRNKQCRIHLLGRRPKWIRLTNLEYTKISSLIDSENFLNQMEIISKSPRVCCDHREISVSLKNDYLPPDQFGGQYGWVILESDSQVPMEIKQLLQELQAITVNHLGSFYWLPGQDIIS